MKRWIWPRAVSRGLALLALSLLAGTVCLAQDVAPPPQAASQAVVAAVAEGVPVRVFNRQLTSFRASFMGTQAADRARRAQLVMNEVLARVGEGVVTVRKEAQGRVLMVDGEMVFILAPDDVDLDHHETLDAATAAAKHQIEQLIAETRESREGKRLWHAALAVLLATLAFAGLVVLLLRGRRLASIRLAALMSKTGASLQIAGAQLLQRDKLLTATRLAVRLFSWVILALLSYQWLSFCLSQFPYTRPWGEQLSGYLIEVAKRIGGGILHALPDLFIALVIFAMARGVINILRPVFDRIERGEATLGWLDCDTVRASRRIISIAIWLFALVMAYPYLPGSGSEAFKGMSVLLGLMISLGASSIVGQGASGMILMFSRTIRVGEFVRIADHEGTITELGMFTTRIRTGLGEELTLPNSLVLSTVTKNYSRTVRGPGFIVDTTVTIGYDTPWRQVEAMLIEAARRTNGVLAAPAPQVYQTALSDFYPEYRLVCQAIPSEPRPRAMVLSQLHAHIQDVFNEYGVQIMSPHYLADPAQAKFVPKSAWFAAPAKPE
ncbi:small-conductance mechanosensitive channel [Paucibacter oligotrophus]|uniref:Small-conductance mechanosensitive channel n=1 Tax=Roseateles oligotrophus TaxID=1769250 RepID=A0A840LDI5_9BURK|nr:mechanosensitive ion channel family protein [Roseateles oligotrophus]MBB4843387.1 small-conductance mechanosensitive channel [Roseateles oligotrophus]